MGATGEVMHWLSLAPVVYLLALRRNAGSTYWLVALGFAASWFPDEVSKHTAGQWYTQPYLPVVQQGLFVAAFAGAALGLVLGAFTLPFAVLADVVWPTVVGSVAAVWHARQHTLAPAIAVYSGVGTLLFLGMIRHLSEPEGFRAWWWPYQTARLTAFGLFVHAAWKEVPDG